MKDLKQAILSVALSAVLFGLVFPLFVWAAGQLMFYEQANGSLVRGPNGNVVGSWLIGQTFVLPKYFHGRPSAAGSGYDPTSSGGTNLGPTSAKLIEGIKDDQATKDVDETYLGIGELARRYRVENLLNERARVPADAVTHSASGLDPEISVSNAMLQARRVAEARTLSLSFVHGLIAEHRKGRFLGIFGEPRVNVLELNLALDRLSRDAR